MTTSRPIPHATVRPASTAESLPSIDEDRVGVLRRSGQIAILAGCGVAVATLGSNAHAATPLPTACVVDDGISWILTAALLLGLGMIGALLIANLKAYRTNAARLVRELDRIGNDARLPAMTESGPTVVARIARSINTIGRRQAEREAQHLDVQASYAHDLRTPLTRMGLRCEMLDDSAARDGMARDLAEMCELVEASIASARMQRSVAEPLQRVDADGLLGNLVRDYRDSGRTIALDGHIGQPVVACPLALRRVLANLIDNALHYGTDVRVCARIDTENLVLAVLDSGPGIRPAQMDAVLAPWMRSQGQEDKPGHGLGLAIARRLVQSMQGELMLQNRRSGGFEARLTLPLVVA